MGDTCIPFLSSGIFLGGCPFRVADHNIILNILSGKNKNIEKVNRCTAKI